VTLRIGDADPVEVDGKVLDGFMTIDKVLNEMKERNLSVMEPPGDDMPKMPSDIGSLDPTNLGRLYSELLAWFNFIATELARVHAIHIQEKNRLSYVKAKLKKELSKKEDIETHPLMLKTLVATQEAEQRFLMVEALSKVLNKNLATVSRNIELRKIAFESDRREGNIGRGAFRAASEEDIKWKTRDT